MPTRELAQMALESAQGNSGAFGENEMRKVSYGWKIVRLVGYATSVALIAFVASLLAAPAAQASTNCSVTQLFSQGNSPPDGVAITFANKSGLTADVYWQNFDPPQFIAGAGAIHLVPYNTLADGTGYVQRTYTGHPWVALDPV